MTLKSNLIIGAIITALLGSGQIAAASTGFTGDDFTSIRGDRPAINPDFDPDKDCDFDTYQLKCIPGSQQDCYDIEGFAQNEDGTCHVASPCPEGYHDGGELDETGQCYPNSQECDAYSVTSDGIRTPYVLTTRSDGIGQTCRDAYEICEDDPEAEACRLIERSTEVNSDDDTNNDIPPYGTIFFCDHPSNPDWCYDRNDNPEEFCVKYPEYEAFCNVIDICDENGSVKPTDEFCN